MEIQKLMFKKPPFKNEALSRKFDDILDTAQAHLSEELERATALFGFDEVVTKLEEIFAGELLYMWPGHGNGSGGLKLFMTISPGDNEDKRTKAFFSECVRKIAGEFATPPDISVEAGQYIAEFPEIPLQFYLLSPSDCMLIEEEVVERRVKKSPHPMCLAALKELEQV